MKSRVWIAILVLLVPLAAACGGPDQRAAVALSCGAAASSPQPPKMPTLGKLSAELSFDGGGNGFTLAPPPTGARPLVSGRQAWKAALPQAFGNYRFVLADMSDDNPYSGSVLDWVLMDVRIASNIESPKPGARPSCTYLDRVTVVNATSGAVDREMTFSPSLGELPLVLTCRHQSPVRGGPSCRWRLATWPWGAP